MPVCEINICSQHNFAAFTFAGFPIVRIYTSSRVKCAQILNVKTEFCRTITLFLSG